MSIDQERDPSCEDCESCLGCSGCADGECGGDCFRGSADLSVGDRVYLRDAYGNPTPAKVSAKDQETITFDLNHEMAGKELNFTIELVEVLD